MKSIRTDDVKVTAKDLGVKVGDKFVVLPVDERYASTFTHVEVGSVVRLSKDDNTDLPYFECCDSGEDVCIRFSCLARYEEPVKEKIVLDKVKFDMVAIAQELGVPLETAHKFVQEMLFEQNISWRTGGKVVKLTRSNWLFVEHGCMTVSCMEEDMSYSFTTLSLDLKKSFVVKKEAPSEIIEVNGHKYALVK